VTPDTDRPPLDVDHMWRQVAELQVDINSREQKREPEDQEHDRHEGIVRGYGRHSAGCKVDAGKKTSAESRTDGRLHI
jgi:hypothetical protein